MPDVLARVKRDPSADDAPPYKLQPLGSGWVLKIERTAGVCVERFVETEAEAHLRAAQLTILMRHE